MKKYYQGLSCWPDSVHYGTVLFGLTSGATVLTAQYWGKGDKTAIEKILALGIRSAVIITAIFTIAAFTIPASLMRIFTNDPQVIAED